MKDTTSPMIVAGNRRFTCLASGLVRLEFSPTGRFEDRRSIVACAEKKPVPFRKIERRGGELHLHTDLLTVVSRDHAKDYFPANLEIRWTTDGLLQCWQPGDRDHQNLGGTIRSYDCLDKYARLEGVHPADMESPDAKALVWLSLLCCEKDTPYYDGAKAKLKAMAASGGIHRAARTMPENMLVRTVNATLDQYSFGPGLLSRSGYFFLNDSTSAVLDTDDFPVERNTPGTRDWYFFLYKDDYAAALRNFVLLSGQAPLPPKNVFGLFFSRWPAYDEQEAKGIVGRFREQGIPLSVLVVDMEWHKPGWCHWDWNPKFYPAPKRFFNWCHRQGLLVTLNDHPKQIREDDSHYTPFLKATGRRDRIREIEEQGKVNVVSVDICDRTQARAFMRICHAPIVRQGMDFWWLDGCNGTLNGTDEQLVSNKLYFENVQSAGRRGMLLSRYAGLGSHRYGVFFTGDSASHWEVLRSQCEFNIRTGHVGVGYISHDIGGFSHPSTPLIDPILYLRWLQFGVFNPVFRFHSAPGSGSRQPWDYGQANAAIALRWLRFRNSLVPYLYSMARQHHDEGRPLVRGLFLEHPRDPAAYRFDEFLFGDALLVAPVLTARDDRTVYLPAGRWYDYATGLPCSGGREFSVMTTLADIPLYAKAGSIVPRQGEGGRPAAAHVDDLLLDVFPGPRGAATLYEDDGRSCAYADGTFATTGFTVRQKGRRILIAGRPIQGAPQGKSRRITIEVALPHPPERVRLDGKPLRLPKGAFTESSHRLCLHLPGRFSVHKGFQVEIDTASYVVASLMQEG